MWGRSIKCALLHLVCLSSRAHALRETPGAIPGEVFHAKQTVPYWTDEPVDRRSKVPPYVPPKDWVYQTGATTVPGKINIHLVPHSHDDTGWLSTVDQYFFTMVFYLIDTTLDCLIEDPNRKFIYVEVGFFARWWHQQPEKRKELMRTVVKRGQLEFINGGWCMHDEASPDYIAMVDQTTRGHQFLVKEFGKDAIPRGTWQIDPFGHQNTQAWLLGAEAGFESLYWGRTDYQDLGDRKNVTSTGKGFEWVWVGSQSLGESASILAGELYGSGNGGYSTWMNFDNMDPQIQDDPMQHDYNIDKWVDKVVQWAQDQASHTQTEHILFATGNDMAYQNAKHWYHNLDKLIHYVNLNGTVNALYSTPSLYTDAKKKANITWEKRYDDVFPLADGAHRYWSGYFTSRPALKRQVYLATGMLGAARQMEVVSGVTAAEVDTPTTRPSPPVGTSWSDSLEGMIAVTTHHDAMSGTERQPVTDDYSLRMAESAKEVEAGIGKSLQKLMGIDTDFFHCNCNSEGPLDCLNVSMCAFTTTHDSFRVVAWNSLATEDQEPQLVRVPVMGDAWTVTDEATGKAIPAQLVPLDERTKSIPLLYINYHGLSADEVAAKVKEYTNTATHVLLFTVNPPPAGYSTIKAVAGKAGADGQAFVSQPLHLVGQDEPPFSVSNGVYELDFDPASGLMTEIKNLKSGLSTPLNISWGWYRSSTGGCNPSGCEGQKSGAYIFRPNNSWVYYPGPKVVPKIEVLRGPVVIEVHQTFSDWATHVVRLVTDLPLVEVEWTAGPIPINTPWLKPAANYGKEVILRYSSGLESGGTFYTDSNCREMVRRDYNARGPSYPALQVNEPVAGNYYPVTGMIAIEDPSEDSELVVLTDAAQGGASLKSGEIELMVHRRILKDDNRGVNTPLNETMCGCNTPVPGDDPLDNPQAIGDDSKCWCQGLTVRGRHWLILDKKGNANAARRQLLEQLHSPPQLAFTDTSAKVAQPSFSSLQAALPQNVKLMTLTNNYASINGGQLMVRFSHLYSVGEHPTLSVPATFSMTDIFSKAGLQIATAKAMSLTGNQLQEEVDAQKFAWKVKDVTGGKVDAQLTSQGQPFDKRAAFDPSDPKLHVTLRPMEVRTFFVTMKSPQEPAKQIIV